MTLLERQNLRVGTKWFFRSGRTYRILIKIRVLNADVQILALLCIRCKTLGKMFNPSTLHFSHP